MWTHISATSRGTFVATRIWLGWSSRVRFPDAKTLDSLSNVSLPSGAGYDFARSLEINVCDASRSVGALPGGNLPFVAVMAPASAPPTQKPRPNACRMFRTSRRSLQMNDSRIDASYDANASRFDAPAASV